MLWETTLCKKWIANYMRKSTLLDTPQQTTVGCESKYALAQMFAAVTDRESWARSWTPVAGNQHRFFSHLLMMPLIWESFSTCCCLRRRSLSSKRFWYCCRILLVCCSCDMSLCSYSSNLRWDILSRSFKEWISSSYSLTWNSKKSVLIFFSLVKTQRNVCWLIEYHETRENRDLGF